MSTIMKTLHNLFKAIRLPGQIIIAVALLFILWSLSPDQIGIIGYKAALVSVAVIHALLIDRALFPYANPAGYLKTPWTVRKRFVNQDADYEVVPEYSMIFCAVLIRRAIIVSAVLLCYSVGL